MSKKIDPRLAERLTNCMSCCQSARDYLSEMEERLEGEDLTLSDWFYLIVAEEDLQESKARLRSLIWNDQELRANEVINLYEERHEN